MYTNVLVSTFLLDCFVRFVRLFNDSGASAVVFTQDANYAGIGSITVKDDDVVILEKHPEDTIYYIGSATLKVARIGVTA